MVESRRHDPRDARHRIEERLHAGVRGEGALLSAPDRDVVRERQHDHRRRCTSLGEGRTKGRGLHIVGVDQRHDLADDRQRVDHDGGHGLRRSRGHQPQPRAESVRDVLERGGHAGNDDPAASQPAAHRGDHGAGSGIHRVGIGDDPRHRVGRCGRLEGRGASRCRRLRAGDGHDQLDHNAEFVVSVRRRPHADRARHRHCGSHQDDLCLGDCLECTSAWNHGGRSHPHRLSGSGRSGPVRGHGRDLDAQQRRALGRALPVLHAGLGQQLGLERTGRILGSELHARVGIAGLHAGRPVLRDERRFGLQRVARSWRPRRTRRRWPTTSASGRS